ncbi:glycogen biosynthesis protein GlgD [Bacillus sp. AY2-1]|nr:glycogen biosynthesis protein GlgD [Bacillus sp. AY2-1]KAA0831987.1 glycogen biosynthesis protein GlgD [Bacillus sp. AY2-1]
MAKRSDQNNPEQKTQNGHKAEFSNELDPIVQVKQRNSKKGQPQKSKQSE